MRRISDMQAADEAYLAPIVFFGHNVGGALAKQVS